jgi:hypothetical protein
LLKERLNEYKRLKEIGDYYDIPSSMVTPEELTEIHPMLSSEGVVGGSRDWLPAADCTGRCIVFTD